VAVVSSGFNSCNHIDNTHYTICLVDIVFLKTWYQVELPKFFNPVTNFIMPPDKRAEWQGMKTLGMLRKETGSKALFSKDSQYQKVCKSHACCVEIML